MSFLLVQFVFVKEISFLEIGKKYQTCYGVVLYCDSRMVQLIPESGLSWSIIWFLIDSPCVSFADRYAGDRLFCLPLYYIPC